MTEKLSATPAPCSTCPYRKDVPSGVWAVEEYKKLSQYDLDTGSQPAGLFMCHGSGLDHELRLCTGWVQCHGYELLALRLASARDRLDPSIHSVIENHPVAVFETGQEAADHGAAQIEDPDEPACKAIRRLVARGGRSST